MKLTNEQTPIDVFLVSDLPSGSALEHYKESNHVSGHALPSTTGSVAPAFLNHRHDSGSSNGNGNGNGRAKSSYGNNHHLSPQLWSKSDYYSTSNRKVFSLGSSHDDDDDDDTNGHHITANGLHHGSSLNGGSLTESSFHHSGWSEEDSARSLTSLALGACLLESSNGLSANNSNSNRPSSRAAGGRRSAGASPTPFSPVQLNGTSREPDANHSNSSNSNFLRSGDHDLDSTSANSTGNGDTVESIRPVGLRARTRPSSRASGIRSSSPSPQGLLLSQSHPQEPVSPESRIPPPQPLTQSNSSCMPTQEVLLTEAMAEQTPGETKGGKNGGEKEGEDESEGTELGADLPPRPSTPPTRIGGPMGAPLASSTANSAALRGSFTPATPGGSCFTLSPIGSGLSPPPRHGASGNVGFGANGQGARRAHSSGLVFNLEGDGANMMGGVSDLFLDDSLLPACDEQLITDAS